MSEAVTDQIIYRQGAFKLIFWGFIFELIDFRIAYFDVLPDVAGYLLIAAGLNRLKNVHNSFRYAMLTAVTMSVCTLPQVLMDSTYDAADFALIPMPVHIYSQLLLGLHLLVVIFIFKGLAALAAEAQDWMLLASTKNRCGMYIVFFAVQLILYPFLLNLQSGWVMILVVFGIGSLIAAILLLHLLYKFSRKDWTINLESEGV